ncbi:MAG: DNA-binding protein [Halococcoides sp.]
MPDEPDELSEAVERAEDAFRGQLGRPDYEDGLEPNANDADVLQLRKACRLLDACRLLRDHDGSHTSVIEMSFAAIERTFEFYALTASNDTIDDFREGHDRAYDRGADLGLVTEETARRLKQLYRDNRAAAYYRDMVPTAQQADAMFDLAVVVHNHVKNFAHSSHVCLCRR